MNKKELKQLIIDNGCKYSDATINYLVDNTKVELIPSFSIDNKSSIEFANITNYISYFFNQESNKDVLINNKDIDVSNLLTRFKVGDIVYYFDKDKYILVRCEITSIYNYISDLKAYSTVCVKRLNTDVDFACFTNNNEAINLFLTKDEAVQTLLDNTFKADEKHKWQSFADTMQKEANKYNPLFDQF